MNFTVVNFYKSIFSLDYEEIKGKDHSLYPFLFEVPSSCSINSYLKITESMLYEDRNFHHF